MNPFRGRRREYAREEHDVRFMRKYSLKGSPRGLRWLEDRQWDDLSSDSDDDYDERGRHTRRSTRPPGAPGTELVVNPKEPKPGECKYKCCPCHAEKLAASKPCGCAGQQFVCHPVAGTACCPKPPEKKPEETRINIDVEDRTGGPMAQRHGSIFPISIAPKATIDDIISMLTPDRSRHKVMVKWDDGICDDLESVTKMDDIRYYVRKLIIKKRKQVRYA
ncbi:hypothetical protein HRG_001733 [Hirsutella rhossiliensis]|uniref:Uncharacterized protein n=1 Tax=Hirsutella rhossiliensis TaxID=111463 RepID=A0A9P8N3U9_9HYPO|nr:uncharacterized protein HRG_01733 [Hirsutella rhossiliensis]KAH0966324.1 hypothetical protein HRG_01733 [Hirsutella rhossiliensis]